MIRPARESEDRIETAAGCCFGKEVGVFLHRSMVARTRMHVSEQHRDGVGPKQLGELQATCLAGVTVRTRVAGTRRNTRSRNPVGRFKACTVTDAAHGLRPTEGNKSPNLYEAGLNCL